MASCTLGCGVRRKNCCCRALRIFNSELNNIATCFSRCYFSSWLNEGRPEVTYTWQGTTQKTLSVFLPKSIIDCWEMFGFHTQHFNIHTRILTESIYWSEFCYGSFPPAPSRPGSAWLFPLVPPRSIFESTGVPSELNSTWHATLTECWPVIGQGVKTREAH